MLCKAAQLCRIIHADVHCKRDNDRLEPTVTCNETHHAPRHTSCISCTSCILMHTQCLLCISCLRISCTSCILTHRASHAFYTAMHLMHTLPCHLSWKPRDMKRRTIKSGAKAPHIHVHVQMYYLSSGAEAPHTCITYQSLIWRRSTAVQ